MQVHRLVFVTGTQGCFCALPTYCRRTQGNLFRLHCPLNWLMMPFDTDNIQTHLAHYMSSKEASFIVHRSTYSDVKFLDDLIVHLLFQVLSRTHAHIHTTCATTTSAGNAKLQQGSSKSAACKTGYGKVVDHSDVSTSTLHH
eukprot:5226769-Amphidinium_carterae.1